MNDDLLVEIKDLRLDFHTFDGVSKVLAGIDLKMRRGDVLGLVGETGCGKTMTALSIPRLIPCPPGRIVSGEVFFEGEDVLNKEEEEMRLFRAQKIGMIFQDPTTNLNPVFTIGEQMTDIIICREGSSSRAALAPFGSLVPPARSERMVAREKAIEWLNRVGIPDAEKRIDHYPHQFSGGMRQRVLIATALSGNPSLLIADEPTTALDVSIQAQILRLIQELVEEMDLSVLLITHNLGVVARMCHRVAVMYAGVVVECADVISIFQAPKHPYTVGLLRAIPTSRTKRGEIKEIPGSIPNFIHPPPGCRFHPRCEYAMPRCAKEPPPGTKEIEPGHEVACFLYS
ncbi:MAG: ABC transporter ATP-binding protein [Anaerolineae bacterium]